MQIYTIYLSFSQQKLVAVLVGLLAVCGVQAEDVADTGRSHSERIRNIFCQLQMSFQFGVFPTLLLEKLLNIIYTHHPVTRVFFSASKRQSE